MPRPRDQDRLAGLVARTAAGALRRRVRARSEQARSRRARRSRLRPTPRGQRRDLLAAGFDQLHEGSAETFSLPRRFDTVVAGELIEHLGNPAGFLARAREHLAPGGRIVLSTPWTFSAHYASYALLKYPDSCQNRQHTMWFCPRTLEELASRVDLRITEVELVADYDLDSPSPVYRRGAKLLLSARRLLPGRLVDNTIIAVLEPVDARVES
ncbi:MAG: methyltransferase domain-containing protein [Actinomycetota bacterium]